MQHGPSYLPSEGIIEDMILYDAVAISSSDGETIHLKEKVCFLFKFKYNNIHHIAGGVVMSFLYFRRVGYLEMEIQMM